MSERITGYTTAFEKVCAVTGGVLIPVSLMIPGLGQVGGLIFGIGAGAGIIGAANVHYRGESSGATSHNIEDRIDTPKPDA